MSKTFADKIIDYNRHLNYTGKLPKGFSVLNPYADNPETLQVMEQFYRKFYNDTRKRKFIVGINPGRHGAGTTGVPFTDTKHLKSACGIDMQSARTHEVSSVFVYDMIEKYGGVKAFYKEIYINSPFPLAIIRKTDSGKWVNANYYDDPSLFKAVKDYMIQSLKTQIGMGLETSEVYVLGKKNEKFIRRLNNEARLFSNLKTLEHPRFIQQYKSKDKPRYINKYLSILGKAQ